MQNDRFAPPPFTSLHEDDIVPWEENTGLIASRYRELGGKIQLIAKPGVGHHPHGLEDSTPIVEFIERNVMKQFSQR